jgi:hypothetical protein
VTGRDGIWVGRFDWAVERNRPSGSWLLGPKKKEVGRRPAAAPWARKERVVGRAGPLEREEGGKRGLAFYDFENHTTSHKNRANQIMIHEHLLNLKLF